MGNLVTVAANDVLNGILATGTAFTAPTSPMKLALSVGTTGGSGNGTATTAGTEPTNAGGSSYARQTITFSVASAGSSSNSAAVNFTNMPTINGSNFITGIDIWDNAGTPIRWWTGAVTTQKQTILGDTLSFAIGAVVAGAS